MLAETPKLPLYYITYIYLVIHLKSLLHGNKEMAEIPSLDCLNLINSTFRVRVKMQQTPLENYDFMVLRVDPTMAGYALVDNQN